MSRVKEKKETRPKRVDSESDYHSTFEHLSEAQKNVLIDLTRAYSDSNKKDKIIWGYWGSGSMPSYRIRSSGRTHSVKDVNILIDLSLAHQRPHGEDQYELVLTKQGRMFCNFYAIGVPVI